MSELIVFAGLAAVGMVMVLKRLQRSNDWNGVLPYAFVSQNQLKLPSYFKYKEHMLTDTRDQGMCNSCWSFGLTSAIADTLAVRSGGAWTHLLSPQFLLSCSSASGHTCEVGASPELVYTDPIVLSQGIPLERDFPYAEGGGGAVVPCQYNTSGLRVYLVPGTGLSLCREPKTQQEIDQNILNMKHALMTYGPIIGTLKITPALINYDPVHHGVFQEPLDSPSLGEHCIEIIGFCDSNVNTHEPEFFF